MRSFLVSSVGFGVLGMILGAAADARAQGGWTDDGVNVRLTSPGDRVGIGTDTPVAKLQVIGNTRVDGKLFLTDALLVPSNGIFHLMVGGRDAFRLDPTASSPNIIGGSEVNVVDAAVVGATIAGGGESGEPNVITGNFGTIGGDRGNQAGNAAGPADDGRFATVGGGERNTASASGLISAVGGGFANVASGQASTVGGGAFNVASVAGATVAGGGANDASGVDSTVAGGAANDASGNFSTVAGGRNNEAAGLLSFAAGSRAKANLQGAFVWADSTNFDFASEAQDQFSARTTGGAQFVSAVNATSGVATAGVKLAAGGNSWASISDRTLKDNITPVDGQDILRRLSAIAITRWNLKAQDPAIKHLGPMAQDFYAAFGLGEDERYINSADADGVALVSIQALYQMVTALEQKMAALDQRSAALGQKTAALEQKSAELARVAAGLEDLRARLTRFERVAERPR